MRSKKDGELEIIAGNGAFSVYFGENQPRVLYATAALAKWLQYNKLNTIKSSETVGLNRREAMDVIECFFEKIKAYTCQSKKKGDH